MEFFGQEEQIKTDKERSRFNRLGLAFFAFTTLSFVVALVVQIGYIVGVYLKTDAVPATYPGWFTWAVSIVALYVVAAPVTFLILRTVPKEAPTRKKMSGRSFFFFLCIAFFLMIVGNLVGNIINAIISVLTQNQQGSAVGDALETSDLWLSVLYTCIMAPILEELFFRKLLIDRLRGAGDGIIILMSGLMFGLFHCNFEQFFYAALIGALLAYIYLNTGNILYCIFIHGIINVCGGLIPLLAGMLGTWTAGVIPNEVLAEMAEFLISMVAILPQYAFAIAGLVIFIIYFGSMRRQIRAGELSMKQASGAAFGSAGVILFLVSTGIQIALNIFA